MVGPRGARQSRRRDRCRAGAKARLAGNGIHRAAFGPLLQNFQTTHGHQLFVSPGEKRAKKNASGSAIPAHPIARGINRYFEIENTEMYGEPFAIPTPDEIVFISWFEGGDVFRSGCTWKRGNGKDFLLRSRGTKSTRSISIPMCEMFCAMPFAGPLPIPGKLDRQLPANPGRRSR